MENGREARKDNDLFFTCALIDYMQEKRKIPGQMSLMH